MRTPSATYVLALLFHVLCCVAQPSPAAVARGHAAGGFMSLGKMRGRGRGRGSGMSRRSKQLHRSGRGASGRGRGARRGRARGRAANGRGSPATAPPPLDTMGRVDWGAASAPIATPAGEAQLTAAWVTVGIKHTSGFAARLASLRQVLDAVATAAPGLPALVAAEGPPPEQPPLPRWVRWVILPTGTRGLSSGRNALAAATTTPMLLLLDDDVMPPPPHELRVLLRALVADPAAALAGACLLDDVPGRLNWRGVATRHCFVHDFEPSEGGRVVRMRRHAEPDLATGRGGGCRRAHVTHNVFLARTAALRRHPWDDRQEVMEHETFFYSLYLNGVPVIACNNVTAVHRKARDDTYIRKSKRFGGGHFQYLCKNFPEIGRFDTQHNTWYCQPPRRRLCHRGGMSEFPFDSGSCQEMEWDERDDASRVSRPLLSPPSIHPTDRFPPLGQLRADDGAALRHIPLLMLLLTQHTEESARRRATQRIWLNRQWTEPETVSLNYVPVRHVYVLGMPGAASGCSSMTTAAAAASAMRGAEAARLEGDMLTLGTLADGCFATSVPLKVLAALRWALAQTSFDVVFKADDDTLTHVGRLWGLVGALPLAERRVLFGGLVPQERGRRVVRPGMTVAQVEQLWGCHPTLPCVVSDVSKYAVPLDRYPNASWPPWALGGPGYLLGVDVAKAVSAEYDRYEAASRGGVGAALPLLPLEDVQVALFAQARGHVPRNLPGFIETAAFQLQPTPSKHNTRVKHTTLCRKQGPSGRASQLFQPDWPRNGRSLGLPWA